MTWERMDQLLKTRPGTGVRATTAAGNVLHFFYEDFNEPGEGINRAMKQLYPQMNKGIYTELIFIDQYKKRSLDV